MGKLKDRDVERIWIGETQRVERWYRNLAFRLAMGGCGIVLTGGVIAVFRAHRTIHIAKQMIAGVWANIG